MSEADIEAIAEKLVASGKGIFAADESSGTIRKRLDSVNVESTEKNRRAYRELLFTAKGASKYISGVILFDETIRQHATDGRTFVDVLDAEGILPGIKVDKGGKLLAGSPEEKVTEGLDGLRERLAEYRDLGARFTKWRAIIAIGPAIPSRYCISVNANALGRFAALSQEAGLVPIVEPEVLMDGVHDIDRCATVTEATLHEVFEQLFRQRVSLEGMLLKPNMVVSGMECPSQASPEEVARYTVKTMKRCVPAAVPGLVFLSGGQSEERATRNLNALNASGPHPWELSFSFGRALQHSALEAWHGDAANVQAAQAAYLHRARMNGAARSGNYSAGMERGSAAASE